jgi:uncharacterized protein YbjT (DUF2867 family)
MQLPALEIGTSGSRARSRADLPSDVELVSFDLERTETFDSALDGVDRVFLMARPGDDPAERCAFPLIDLMEARGVRHVVDLSAMGATRTTPATPKFRTVSAR